MKRTLYFVFIAVALLLGGLFPSQVTAEVMRVMLHEGSFPPYFFDDDDERTGTIRDIFAELAMETGDAIEFVRVPFKRALFKFENGEIDIEPMVNPIWRQSSPVPGVYSEPYVVAADVVLFRKGQEKQVLSPNDLIGETLGVINGYSYPTYDPYFDEGRITKLSLKNENELMRMLVSGRLDQVLISKDFAQYQMKEQKLSDVLVVGDSYSRLDNMIRFHPSKSNAVKRYNDAINKLLENGTIERIFEKYR